eukprot:tig00021135_g18926.t1
MNAVAAVQLHSHAVELEVLRFRSGHRIAGGLQLQLGQEPPLHVADQTAVFEKLEAREAARGPAPALVFDTAVHQLHWLRFPDAATLAGTGVLLTANKVGPPSIAVQSSEWTVYLVVGADGTVGPFSFSEAAQDAEQAVELLARRADTGAPLTDARIVFVPRGELEAVKAEVEASPLNSQPSAVVLGPPGVVMHAAASSLPGQPPAPPSVAAHVQSVASWHQREPSGRQQPGPDAAPVSRHAWPSRQTAGDAVSPLELAARMAERQQRLHGADHEQPSYSFLDPAVISGLESLVIGAREGEAAGAGAGEGERPARRVRRVVPGLEESESLLRRIDAAADGSAGDVDDAPAPPPPPALLAAAEAGPDAALAGRREQDFVFESDAARAAFEERAGAALRALAAAPSPDTAAAFLRAFASGPALDSRFVSAPSGQRDLRRAALLLRAAARSVAPEQSALGGLVSSAVNGIMFFSRFAPEKLVAACERSWELADAVTPPTTGVALDLALVPVPQLVQLARLAAAFLEPLSEETPGPYAEALSFLGLRLLQNLEDEEACRVLYSAWELVKRRGLSPCRAECRAIRCITMSLARRNQTERAAETAACCYWFEQEGRLAGADWRIKFGSIDSIARVALNRKDWQVAVGLLPAFSHLFEQQMDPEEADVPNFAFMRLGYAGTIALHRGRYVDFIRLYRRTLRVIREGAELLFASPLLDVRNAFRATPGAHRAMASGFRLAVLLQRALDWSGQTPVLAHMLYSLAGDYARLGDARRAASTLREALKEYGRFPGTFPGDHPRVLAARAALAACSGPPSPVPSPALGLSPASEGGSAPSSHAHAGAAATDCAPPPRPRPAPALFRFFR